MMPSGDAVPVRPPAAGPASPADLPGWEADDLEGALAALSATADHLPGLSSALPRDRDGLARAMRCGPPQSVGFTGYYEPVVEAALAPGAGFDHPLYALPPHPHLSRAEIAAGALAGRGLEIAWLRDPLEAFLMQVQGSGRLRIAGRPDLRLGYAGANGLPYRSIGAELIRRGAIAPADIGLGAIRDWAAQHPDAVPGLLLHNPSFVFFRRLDLAPDLGPLGSLGRSVTPWRSLAVDPAVVPLGSPVWVELDEPLRLRRLMVAQDTGSAIRGARADIFTGTGPEAGEIAGRIRHAGRITVLRPAGA